MTSRILCLLLIALNSAHGQIRPDLLEKAAKGNLDAQIELAYIYESGTGVPVDKQKAIAWYRKAAEQGSAHAQFSLARQYQSQDGVPNPQATEGIKWYRRAADQGHVNAKFNLFTIYRYGLGVPADYAESMKWLSMSAFSDYPPAQANLGYSYLDGIIIPKDPIEGLAWLYIASSQHELSTKEYSDYSQKLGAGAVVAAQRRASELRRHIQRVELGNWPMK